MKQRFLTGLVGIPIVLLALFGPILLAEIFIALIGLGMIYEYLKLTEHFNIAALIIIAGFMLTMIILAATLSIVQLEVLIISLILLSAAARWGLKLPLWNTFGILYIGTPLALIINLRVMEDGQKWLLMILLITWVTDSMALFGGKAFGRTKLAPTISPNKTREGTAIGVVSGFLIGMLGGALLGLVDQYPLTIVFTSLILPPLAVIGDLVESKLKRVYGKKDSGTFFPGHGGFLDRVDSILFTASALWLIVVITV